MRAKGIRLFFLPLVLTLSGCDQIRDWLVSNFGQPEDLKKIEERLDRLERAINVLRASVDAHAEKGFVVGESFQDCVLDRLSGVTSDLAAASLKVACLLNASQPLPDLVQLEKSSARYGEVFGYAGGRHLGLYIMLRNDTPFTITELGISISNLKTGKAHLYTIRDFSPPVDRGTLAGPPPTDPTTDMQVRPGEAEFTLVPDEFPDRVDDFFRDYAWTIVSAKGFLR